MTIARRSSSKMRAAQAVAPDSLADHLVSELASLGLTTYFGVPGGAIEPLFNALARQQRVGEVRLVPMRSEAGAGFAADGYFRQTGQMAACTVTTGPGVSNLLTATMAAHADRIPFLLITPQAAQAKQGRGALQESSQDGYDMPRIFESCTRYSSTVTHPGQLPHKLARALAAATRAPSGPVHLSIPSDVLGGQQAEGARLPAKAAMCSPEPVDHGAVEALLEDLLTAQAPVFYVGDDAGPEAHRLCDVAGDLGAKVISSPAGKRWLGHQEPSYVGVLGFSGHPAAAEAVRRADFVVAFGATFDELSTNAWTAFPEVPIRSVDRHTAHAHRLPTVTPILSEPSHVVRRILECVPEISARVRARTLPPPMLVHDATGGAVHPADLMRWLGASLPRDVVVHVDAGNGFSWSTRYLARTKPDTYRVAMGLSTMSWAIGAAIGAAVGRRRRTVCVAGDGSMLMSSLEMTVAVEQNLPVTYVVLNDSSYGMVRHGQRLGGAESIAHSITPVRFDQLALACGASAFRADTFADLEHVPHEFLGGDQNGCCVIDVRIDPDAVPPIGDRVAGLAAGVTR
jgi:acetolactate synthase I/II/III large subunit